VNHSRSESFRKNTEKMASLPQNRSRIDWPILISILFLVAADQLTKALVFAHIPPGRIVCAFWGFGLTSKTNTGFALSVLKHAAWVRPFVMIISMILVPTLILIYPRFAAKFKTGWFAKISLVLMISGILGNFCDRLFLGYVRDFIVWPGPGTPNLADLFIDAGIVCLMVESVKNKRLRNSSFNIGIRR